MEHTESSKVCKTCGFSGAERFCASCGQPFEARRITIKTILHDVFHFFTHLDKGFLFTLKLLFTAPGKMQRQYVDGFRANYQKPFSMFFICATALALFRYAISHILADTHDLTATAEADFVHNYLVVLQASLVPIYTLVVYIMFLEARYNYAEIGVLMLYNSSFFFIATAIVSALKLIFNDLNTVYIELPVIVFYNVITFIHFFNTSPRWLVILKAIVLCTVVFFLIRILEFTLVEKIYLIK